MKSPRKIIESIIIIMVSVSLIPFSNLSADTIDNYRELEYVEVANGPYFRTGINDSKNNAYEYDIAFTSLTGTQWNGHMTSYQVNNVGVSVGKITIQVSNWSGRQIAGDTSRHTIKVDLKNLTTTIDGITQTMTINNLSSQEMIIGASVNPQNQYVNKCSERIYGYKAWTNDTLIMDLTPVKRISDNAVGLYDEVNDTFIQATGGTPTAGPEIIQSFFSLTVNSSNSNYGLVTGSGTYTAGTSATITASANDGYVFSGWYDGSTLLSTNNPYSYTVNGSKTITGRFDPDVTETSYTLSVTANNASYGTVTGSGTYTAGTSATLTASANDGYVFSGWYDGSTLLSTNNPYSYTVTGSKTITGNFREYVEPSITLEDNGEIRLENITSYYDDSQMKLIINKKLVIDNIDIATDQITLNNVGRTRSYSINLTGSIENNEILTNTLCNATSYTTSKTSADYDSDEIITVKPQVTGNIGTGGFNLGFSLGTEATSATVSTSIENETQACRLVSLDTDAIEIDMDMLEEIGYERHQMTVSSQGGVTHLATVMMPPAEDLSMTLNGSQLYDMLDDLMDDIFMTMNNQMKITYHYEYDMKIVSDNNYIPLYGELASKSYLKTFLNWYVYGKWAEDLVGSSLNYYYIPNDDVAIYSTNYAFNYGLTNNRYNSNSFTLKWFNTRNPVWRFQSEIRTESVVNFLLNNNVEDIEIKNRTSEKTSALSTSEYLTITASDVSNNPALTQGAQLPIYDFTPKYYELKDTSNLSILQSFTNWLNSKLNNININVTNNDFDNNVTEIQNNYEINIQNSFGDIDLTDDMYQLNTDITDGLGFMKETTEMVIEEGNDSGIGIIFVLPLVLMILGRIIG